MVETTIFKGYRNGKEVWAIGKTYGQGETETKFICEVEPTKEVLSEYGKQKNVYNNARKKERLFVRGSNKKQKNNNSNIPTSK